MVYAASFSRKKTFLLQFMCFEQKINNISYSLIRWLDSKLFMETFQKTIFLCESAKILFERKFEPGLELISMFCWFPSASVFFPSFWGGVFTLYSTFHFLPLVLDSESLAMSQYWTPCSNQQATNHKNKIWEVWFID